MAAAYKEVEVGLSLLGVTGVEDRLQDGVEQTVQKLRAAGIRVWVLTGDKLETARHVAFSARIFDQTIRVHELCSIESLEQAERSIHTLIQL